MSADRIRANIKARLSLRDPQADSLDILANVLERIPFSREPWPGELLFSIGRCMHSTGFCSDPRSIRLSAIACSASRRKASTMCAGLAIMPSRSERSIITMAP